MKTAAELAQPAWEQLGGLQCDEIWEALKSVAQLAVDARRLVEEAQAETRRVNNEAQLRLAAVGTAAEEAQAERDRLKGELSMERNAYDATLYRLKGELAEARRLLRAMKATFSASTPWTNEEKAVDDYLAALWGVAATPAEQAQGEGGKQYVACAGTCGRRVMVYPGEDPVWHCGNAHCQIRTAAPDGHHRSSREASLSPQTENYAEKVRMPVDSDAQRHDNGLLAQVNARLDALTARLDRISSPPPRPFVTEVKRHWDDPAVRDNFVDATLDDHEYRLRGLEARFKTEGEKP